jgi:hypothetical protein
MGLECRSQLPCLFFSFRQQRKIGAAGVPSVFGPFSGSVAKQPELTFLAHGVDQCAVFVLSPNVKPVIARHGDFGQHHPFDGCSAWATLAPQTKLVQGHLASFRLNFYLPVVEVSHPTTKAKVEGSSPATVSESHSLHAAFNQETPALLQGLLSLTAVFYDVVSICLVTVSRAARHRHEIVEELAQ